MFGNWLNGVDRNDKARTHIGVSALCWSIWTCRNSIVFDKKKDTNFLQVILLATHWIQSWFLLLPEVQRELMVTSATGCWRSHKISIFRLLDDFIAFCCYFYFDGWCMSQP
jgi:hypothetical protein